MNLYLDTEFDGFGGDLISIALAGDDGSHWYGVFEEFCVQPWVKEHVAPKLHVMPPTITGERHELLCSLHNYLSDRRNCTVYADWPADFEHLMRLMRADSHDGSFFMPMRMELIDSKCGPKPVHPHNALSDAIALRDWHKENAQ
jgi:hypothetical protein